VPKEATDGAATAALAAVAADVDVEVDAAAAALSNTLSLASSPSLSASASESDPGASSSPQSAQERERWDDHDIDAAAASVANNSPGKKSGNTAFSKNNNGTNNAAGASASASAANNTSSNILLAARTPPRRETIHNNYPYSSVSPRVPQSYIIGRTQSSPSIIDASPKLKLSPKPGSISISTSSRIQNHQHQHHPAQLTPVARNTSATITTTKPFTQNTNDNAANNNTNANKLNKDEKIQYLSVPEQGGSKRGEGSNSSMIRPRRTTAPTISTSSESNESRPISPPTWLSHRASAAPTSTSARNAPALASIPSSGSSPHSSTSSPSSSKENADVDLEHFSTNQGRERERGFEQLKDEPKRFPSPLNQGVRLDRNHHSFPCKYQHQHQPRHRHQSSPESIFGSNTPQPRSPPNEGPGAKGSLDTGLNAGLSLGVGEMDNESSLEELLIAQPYQPSRNSSLASFGVVSDELDDIFLPMRRHRSSKSKSSKLRRSNGFGDSDDEDVDDSFTQVSDSQSSTSFTSFPSIRLGVRIRSSTQDSVTTVEGCSTFDDEDSLVFQHQDGSLYLGAGGSVGGGRGGAASAEKKKKNHGRRLSSHEEKQVYDWLRGLEVDKDNNEYVAEAASSKFLTGKMNNIDEYTMDNTHGRFVTSPDFVSRVEQVKDGEQKVEGNDENNVDMKEKKDSSRDPSSVRTVKSSSNNIVMGRNVCAFDRNRRSTSSIKNNTKGKPSTFKVSGLYR